MARYGSTVSWALCTHTQELSELEVGATQRAGFGRSPEEKRRKEIKCDRVIAPSSAASVLTSSAQTQVVSGSVTRLFSFLREFTRSFCVWNNNVRIEPGDLSTKRSAVKHTSTIRLKHPFSCRLYRMLCNPNTVADLSGHYSLCSGLWAINLALVG